MNDCSAFYLYGIFPSPGPQHLDLLGLDKQPVHAHQVDGFSFLCSEAKQDRYLASRRNLLCHEQVLEEAMQAGYRTVLPLQFGLTVENWQEVQALLIEPYREQLKHLFEKLKGYREVSVKVLWEMEEELQQLLAENEELRAKRDRLEGQPLAMDQVIGIGQALEQALQRRQDGIIAQFQQVLNPLAIEVIENESLTDAMIYNTAYLIPWDDEPEFSQQVEHLDLQFEGRLRIRYNNFTAPFNFAKLED
ncbi:MAG: GvpL/GvpF family gas vesicle protein [Roseofilum sp. SBFL]|uniref:gas vesicle protein GvpF n=1 Tax=unclassified Roseofilum TaxID=2620099 RepID=UPI001B2EDB0B|nr:MULTISPECIES: GvpL/GvpF family gas vesicle protein [unclassified Roseofilum]MBP0012555.1 GvpL/GvpF family gas vesicle protein [Roseofilum sp. SID3]MBP0024265.1 GvpL/GvpF family gas vesicle protein [Roseofilum sp. SID2]MBP0040172.1 GvpL/GvpF family gas vesicle protein [Roseofilum sp. SID1]MBP0042462.1 GvpL/GvpF family gas vesicle protein [Roseofilum sp. SBFL]